MNIDIIQKLAEKLVWIAPVGTQHIDYKWPESQADLRGFMVCRRSINNVDQGNTRVDYLMLDGHWKSPFAENRSLFPTLKEALDGACKATEQLRATPKCPTCEGRGQIGGVLADGSSQTDPCPECAQ